MIGVLPTALTVAGREIPINSDFRVMLAIYEAFNDDELNEAEKAYVCLKLMYREPIAPESFEDAVRQAYWFFDGGEIPKDEPAKARIVDWKKDERIIMPAISKTIGVTDVRSLPYLHWWTFLGAFGEMGEGLFSTILNLRRKRADGEKLEKWEEKYIRKHSDLIELRTKEDEEAIAETEAVIKELFHEV